MPLSDTAIRQARPRAAPFKLADGGGMFLLVQPTGAKYWRLKYRIRGREKLLALGVYPQVSLAKARQKRDSARELIAAGIDPIEHKREEQRVAAVHASNSFEVVAREWHGQQAPRWTPGHATQVLWTLDSDAFPKIGHRPVNEITAPEVLAVLRDIEKRNALEVAGRVRQRCGAVFRYAIQTGRATYNPVADLAGALKTRKVTHRAALGQSELPEFLSKLAAYNGHLLTRLALRLLVLTMVRTGELRGARWDEIDEPRAEWRIPAGRMKMRQPHLVPLSHQAIEVLRAVRPLTGHGPLLFPAQTGDGKPMSENTMLYAIYRMGYHGRATGHGFRATASTILNELGFRPDVIERQLAHAERNKVRAAYHRSEYLDERRTMMQAWADLLDALANPKGERKLLSGRPNTAGA